LGGKYLDATEGTGEIAGLSWRCRATAGAKLTLPNNCGHTIWPPCTCMGCVAPPGLPVVRCRCDCDELQWRSEQQLGWIVAKTGTGLTLYMYEAVTMASGGSGTPVPTGDEARLQQKSQRGGGAGAKGQRVWDPAREAAVLRQNAEGGRTTGRGIALTVF
jgi:hypothetical protein